MECNDRFIPRHPPIADLDTATRLARTIIADTANYQYEEVGEAVASGVRERVEQIFEEERTENFNLRVIPELVNAGIWEDALDFLLAKWKKDIATIGRIRGSQ
jgi:uncharacterized hydantoinase/oxoprolinase family protein